MPGKFQWRKFSECNLSDHFFVSLVKDYTEFPVWFARKSKEGEKALVFSDEYGVYKYLRNG